MFRYRLAAHLKMTVGELMSKLSTRELLGWYAYYALEPWGASVEDHRFGVITSTVMNMFAKGKTFTPRDVFPSRMPGQKEKDDQAQLWSKVDKVMSSMPNVRIMKNKES